MSCSACLFEFSPEEDYVRCTVMECKKMYHHACAGGKQLDEGTWICPECRCSLKKGGDNSSTPVGISKHGRDNVTIRQRKKATSTNPLVCNLNVSNQETPATTPISNKESALSDEIRCMRQEMSLLREQLCNAVTLIQSYEAKLEHYALQAETLQVKMQGLESTILHSIQIPPQIQIANTITPVQTQKQNTPTQKSIAIHSTGPTQLALQKGSVPTDNTTSALISDNNLPNVAVQQSLPSLTDQQPEWTQITKRTKEEKRRPISLCGTAGPAVTTLKAVEARRYIHLWNMQSTAEEVRDYLMKLCSTESCTVEELTPRGNYKSYKLGVPAVHFNTCMSTDVWPANSRIKTWFQHKRSSDTAKPVINQQPFRDADASK